MHIEEGRLQAFIDGELSNEEVDLVESHLRGCLACGAELAQLEAAGGSFSLAVGLLEPTSATAPAVPMRSPFAVVPARSGWRALPRAAVFVVGVATAAAAAVPGSPVRRWVQELARAEQPVIRTLPDVVVHSPASAAAEAGVSVDLRDGRVRVALRDAAPQLTVHAVLVDGPRAGVLARGRAADARFHTAAGSIEVSGADGGELRIELPRAAREATVWVNGREYLRKDSDRLHLAVPPAGRSGADVTFRIHP